MSDLAWILLAIIYVLVVATLLLEEDEKERRSEAAVERGILALKAAERHAKPQTPVVVEDDRNLTASGAYRRSEGFRG